MKRKDGTLKRILSYVAPYRSAFLLVLLFSLLSVAATLYVPILTGNAIDFIIGPNDVNFPRIVPILMQLLVTIGVGALAQYLLGLFTNRLSYGVARDIRLQAMDKLEVVPLKTIDTNSHGDILSRVITDVNQVSEGLLMGFTQLFSGVITIVGTLGFMFSVDARIAAVVVVVTPLSLLVANFIARRTFSMFKLQSATRGELTALVEEMVGNQKVVKAFGHEGENEAAFDKINERLRSQSLRATFFSSITNPSTRFVNGVVYALVCLFGALMALDGGLSVGALVLLASRDLAMLAAGVYVVGVACGIGNGVVFKLVPQHFRAQAGPVNGIVAMMGGLGGFFPPFALQASLSATGGYGAAFATFGLCAAACLATALWWARTGKAALR